MNLMACFYFTEQTLQDAVVLVIMCGAIIGNHIILIKIGWAIKNVAIGQDHNQKKWLMAPLVLLKLLLLIVALLLGIHFIQGLVLIPVVLYICQLFILTLCLKR